MDHHAVMARLQGTSVSGVPESHAYVLVERLHLKRCQLAIGRSRTGDATLLVIGAPCRLQRALRTEGLHVHDIPAAIVDFGTPEEVTDTIAVECLAPSIEYEFSVLVSCLLSSLAESEDPARDLMNELSSWRALFSRVPPADRAHEQGLWGELWVLAQSVMLDGLLLGWRGPEGGPADFFMGGYVLEVKTCRAPGTAQLSQKQADLAPGAGWLLLVPLEEDPSGRTCRDLAEVVSSRAVEPSVFFRALRPADLACIRSECPRRFSLLARPTLHPLELVPRVRRADAGVYDIRYKVDLEEETTLTGGSLVEALGRFGVSSAW